LIDVNSEKSGAKKPRQMILLPGGNDTMSILLWCAGFMHSVDCPLQCE